MSPDPNLDDRKPLPAARGRRLPPVGASMADDQFDFLAKLVHDRTGIMVRPEKRQMLCSRLDKRLRALGLGDFAAYCDYLESDLGPVEIAELVNAITTNLTHFFREKHHFEQLAKHALPAAMKSLEARHSKRLRIWSAGCSTGQEPYSIAMTLLGQAAGIQSWDARILATDVDSNVIDHAAAGRYAADQADGVPETYRKRFTRRQRDGALEMTDDLRRSITFKQLNLMEPWPISGPFEIIFCRNVVIYFDKPTQATLFDRFASLMPVGGWLYIGHSESLFKVTERFRLIGGTIYQKVA